MPSYEEATERAESLRANEPTLRTPISRVRPLDSIKVYGVPSPKDDSLRKGGGYAKL